MRRATVATWALCILAVPLAASANERLRKGPWLMDLRTDGVVVMAERATPGALVVRAVPQGPGGDQTDGVVTTRSGVDAQLQELAVTGLRPGTRYRYEVSAPDLDVVEGTFATAPAEPVPFRFVIYGDTRSHARAHGTTVEAIVHEGAAFAVHTGDLLEDGRDDEDWQGFFDIEAPLLRSCPFVPVIGNHEIARPLSNGIENFRRYVHVAPGGPSNELDWVFRYGGVRFVLANAYDDWSGPARDWLDRELGRARSEAPNEWLFVVMHWGPRSSGPHGDNVLLQRAAVDGILRRHHVDLVISGHDHAYERGDDEGLRFLVSGGAGAPLYERDEVRPMTRFFASEHHYVRVEVEREQVRFTALRPDGSTLETATLRHDGWTDAPRSAPVDAPPAPPPAIHDTHARDGDWSWVWKAIPAAVAVGLGAWGLRRKLR